MWPATAGRLSPSVSSRPARRPQTGAGAFRSHRSLRGARAFCRNNVPSSPGRRCCSGTRPSPQAQELRVDKQRSADGVPVERVAEGASPGLDLGSDSFAWGETRRFRMRRARFPGRRTGLAVEASRRPICLFRPGSRVLRGPAAARPSRCFADLRLGWHRQRWLARCLSIQTASIFESSSRLGWRWACSSRFQAFSARLSAWRWTLWKSQTHGPPRQTTLASARSSR